jgi:3-deoxy-D-manno-octulosonic-acid transferase
MNARLALFLYNLLFPFALLVMLPGIAMRIVRRGNYRHKFAQRFGFYDAETRARLEGDGGGRIWIHSISVGETVLALKLAEKMKALDPSARMVLSATTSTGFALADKQASGWLEVIYNPLDALPFVRRSLGIIRPGQLVFIEAMWPNLLLGAKKRGIPVAMIPRLSQRAELRYRKFRFFTGGFFGAFDCMCAQESDDPPRLASVGVDPSKIRVTGSIKFDQGGEKPSPRVREFRAMIRSLGADETAPVLLAGSTFPGEEKALAQIFRELRAKFPGLFLILVPRHVERTPEVIEDLKPFGLRVALRSRIEPGAKADCLVVDTTGELRDWYHVGTVIFIGKSLDTHGGQNPVEAVAAGKPVVFGPHMENFRNITRVLVDHRAAMQVENTDALRSGIDTLLSDPRLREEMAGRAGEALAQHRGATERAASLLLAMRQPARSAPPNGAAQP